MIGKVQRGKRINGLVRYLFGPGECNEHVHPHVVAGFRPAAALEPGIGADGSRDVAGLNRLLNQPLALIPEEEQPERPVRHVVLRAAPEDPVLSDDDWADIAHEVMDATGRAAYGDDGGVRWVAVRHAADHIHIAFNLARQDGARVLAWDDYRALRAACQWIEARYGLRATAPADGAAAKRASRAETERAERSGRNEPVRITLRRVVQHAAAAAWSEPDFFARLRADGVDVRLRHSAAVPGSVTGYAVALPSYRNAAGEPVWFGGGRLAADLTLPRLRHRWAGQPQGTRLPGRASLRGTVRHAAAAARDEGEFFGLLAEYGLRVRLRHSHLGPRDVTGYAVAYPDPVNAAGTAAWTSGGALAADLTLPHLRRRWGGQSAPAFEQRDRAWRRASDAVAHAAREIRALAGSDPGAAADAAWAAADVLNITARLLGHNRQLREAAEVYDRAARDLRGRIPRPTRSGTELRAAARMLANSAGEDREQTRAILTMIEQLGGLADAVAHLRTVQQRHAQAAAAVRAHAALRAVGRPTRPAGFVDARRTEFPYDARTVVREPATSAPGAPRRQRTPAHGPRR